MKTLVKLIPTIFALLVAFAVPALASPGPTTPPATEPATQPPATSPLAPPAAPPSTQAMAEDDDDWHGVLMPYGWLSSVKLDADVRDSVVHTDIGIGDILDNLDGLFQLHGEVGKGKWTGMFDVNHVSISTDKAALIEVTGPFGRFGRDVTLGGTVGIRMTVLEFGGAYRFAKTQLGSSNDGKFAFEGLAGIRPIRVEATVSPLRSDERQASRWLVDPYVGARGSFRFNKHVGAWLTSTIGGFGAGADFDTTFDGSLVVKPHKNIGLVGGYKVLYINGPDSHEGLTNIKLTLHGPYLGLAFVF